MTTTRDNNFHMFIGECISRLWTMAAALLFTDEYAKYIAATESKKIYVLVTDYMDTGANDIRGK